MASYVSHVTVVDGSSGQRLVVAARPVTRSSPSI